MKTVNITICAALLGMTPVLSSAADTVATLETQKYGAVPFVSGGVGDDSRQQIERISPEYPLQLLFATKGTPNEFLADVKVKITDKDGKVVLDAVSEGPYLLTKLPPGKYSISAASEGAEKSQKVQLSGGKPQRLVFVW